MVEEKTEDIKNNPQKSKGSESVTHQNFWDTYRTVLEEIGAHIKLSDKLDIVGKPCNFRKKNLKQKDCLEFKAILVFIEGLGQVSSI